MGVLTVTVSLIVFPVAIVDVSVGMDESSTAVGFVMFPVSLIDAAVRPNLISSSVSHLSSNVPHSIILSVVSQDLKWFILQLNFWLVVFILIDSVLKSWQQLLYLLNFLSLLLKFLGVHFDVNSTRKLASNQTWLHCISINCLNLLSG